MMQTLDHSLFNGIPDTQLNDLDDVLVRQNFPSNTVLFQQDDGSDELYFIESGMVEIVNTSEAGNEHVIATMKSGDSFGDMAFLGATGRTASAHTKGETQLKILKKPDLMSHSNGQKIYNKLVANIALENTNRLKNSNQAYVSSMEDKISGLKDQMDFGHFFLYVIMTSAICMIVNELMHSYLSFVSIYSLEFFLTYAIILMIPNLIIIKKLGIPLSEMGITLKNWQVSLKEGIIASVIFFALFMSALWVLENHYGMEFKSTYYIPIVTPFYVLHTFLQELFVRGFMQTSFQRFLKDEKGTRSVVITSMLFGLFHIHLGIPAVGLTFLASLFFGWFYLRTFNLIGVTVFHLVAGILIFGSGIM